MNLFSFLISSVLTLLQSLDVQGQDLKRPSFDQYQIKTCVRKRRSPVNLSSHKLGKLFKTRLTSASKEDPNFACRYVLSIWGCGSDCQYVAIIDIESGQVYLKPFMSGFGYSFQRNSSLLIVNPIEESGYDKYKTMRDEYKPGWYAWEKNRLILIHSWKDEM